MCRKALLVFLISTIVSFHGHAQQERENTRGNFWERAYFGGSFALQFGNYTYIDVSPLMGYGITERFSSGVGFTYQYVDYYGRSYNVYGGRIFSRYGIFRNVFAHAEYESLNIERRTIVGELERRWSDAFFIGGGYSSSLGGQKGFQAYILFNLTYDAGISSYDEPYVIRFSITF